MNAITKNDSTLISQDLKTTSLIIAEKFGKRHDNVLRAIQLLEIPQNYRLLNFEEREEIQRHSTGATKKIIIDMTRDGFSLLVMGFTGKKAMQWKIRFLQAFNAMEMALCSPTALLHAPTLTNGQQRQIQQRMLVRFPDGIERAHAYIALKERFDVARYYDIPQAQFKAVMDFLGICTPSHSPAEALDRLTDYLDITLEDKSMMSHTWCALNQMRVIINFLRNNSSINIALLKRRAA